MLDPNLPPQSDGPGLLGQGWKRGLCRSQVGQATVELALSSLLLIMLVMGAAEVGRALSTFISLTSAAREGARVGGACQSTSQIATYANNATSGLGLTSSNVALSYLASDGTTGAMSAAVGGYIRVTVSFDYTPITPVIGPIFNDLVLSTSRASRIETLATSGCP